eukprot:2264039-Lingulodinium_polyedra.AAC.1
MQSTRKYPNQPRRVSSQPGQHRQPKGARQIVSPIRLPNPPASHRPRLIQDLLHNPPVRPA